MADKSILLIQQENLELVKENEALKFTLTQLLEEINRLRELDKPSNPNKIQQSPELSIIEDQIASLETVSRTRGFSLEEIRGLDLLIKNKKLLEPTTPIEVDYTKVPDGQTESDLLRIAGNVELKKSKKRSKSKTSTEDPVA